MLTFVKFNATVRTIQQSENPNIVKSYEEFPETLE